MTYENGIGKLHNDLTVRFHLFIQMQVDSKILLAEKEGI